MAEERPESIRGYAVVPDSGPGCPYAADGHGTEAANEGKAAGGNKWAKRKGAQASPTSYESGT